MSPRLSRVLLCIGAPPLLGACPPSVERLSTGALPNDVAALRCDGTDAALVPSSADDRVDVLFFDGAEPRSIALPHSGGAQAGGSSPWAVAVDDDGDSEQLAGLALVSLFFDGSVALVDPCGGKELSRARPLDTIVPIDPPVDVDGDGTLDAQLAPRFPEGVLLAGGAGFAVYTDALALGGAGPEEPPSYARSVLARFAIAPEAGADALVPDGALVLPDGCVNAQAVIAGPSAGELVVSCSGAIGRDADGGPAVLSDGRLVVVDAAALTVTREVPLGREAPGTPAVVGGRIVVGSLVAPAVLVLDGDDDGGGDGGGVRRVPLADEPAIDSVFSIDAVFDADGNADGTVLAPRFSADELVRIDVAGAEVIERISVDSAAALEGPLAVDTLPFPVVLLGLAAEVRRLP